MVTNNAINLKAAGIAVYDGAGSFTADTVTQNAIITGGASNTLISTLLTNGQLAIGDTGNQPVASTLTSGTGINIVNGAGSITVNAIGGGLFWNDVTGMSASGAANNGYVADNASLVSVSLPLSAPFGSVFAVIGGVNGTSGWKILQAAGQQINFGKSQTTSGVTGYLQSTAQFDGVYLLCVVTNQIFVVLHSIGNITVN